MFDKGKKNCHLEVFVQSGSVWLLTYSADFRVTWFLFPPVFKLVLLDCGLRQIVVLLQWFGIGKKFSNMLSLVDSIMWQKLGVSGTYSADFRITWFLFPPVFKLVLLDCGLRQIVVVLQWFRKKFPNKR